MTIRNGVVEAIGNTPLIKLKRASQETGCEIWGKAEFLNPGQSVKDRAALFIIHDAIAKVRRASEARRHHRRGHGRQYRHRAHAGGQFAGLRR
jgi:threonine dehydratase